MQPTIHDAVFVAYPNVMQVAGNDINSLEAIDSEHKPVAIVPATVEAELVTLQTNYANEQQAQANAKASALAKLAALGLTQDEVKAIVG